MMDESGFQQAQQLADRLVDVRVSSTSAAINRRPLAEQCIECERPISAERRFAAPFAERCVDCQRAIEKRRGRK